MKTGLEKEKTRSQVSEGTTPEPCDQRREKTPRGGVQSQQQRGEQGFGRRTKGKKELGGQLMKEHRDKKFWGGALPKKVTAGEKKGTSASRGKMVRHRGAANCLRHYKTKREKQYLRKLPCKLRQPDA